MKTIVHKAGERGHANHGWLNAKHSFSFAQWHDQSKIHFGALRVLNDDEVAGGTGFGKHPHANMEIVTLVQEGALEHQDSMQHRSVMRANDVQVMSAGSGVHHSEVNHSRDEAVKLFQIWIFPDKENVTPRYDQKAFSPEGRKNQWQEIIKPDTQQDGEALWVHQQAWFSLADLDAGTSLSYAAKAAGNGAYVFLIDGEAEVAGELLQKRDAIGISEYDKFEVKAASAARLLVIDVPMYELTY